jgi:HEAT repeat protein
LAIGFVEKSVQDPDVQRRQSSVARAIGDIRDRSILPALESLLFSPSASLRRAAAHALRGMSDPASARFLVRALDDNNGDEQYDALMALAKLVGLSG